MKENINYYYIAMTAVFRSSLYYHTTAVTRSKCHSQLQWNKNYIVAIMNERQLNKIPFFSCTEGYGFNLIKAL